eukprot:TRINITY_DN0_c0_g1_i3.p1 TRINITY_DN0_c0_g1~~TRINITY_DN0_c0_g1_i3.p1  ORF type:complete len:638 (+),score=44.70 TRINITY_DN0_c0_g1_i3:46-1959(+)
MQTGLQLQPHIQEHSQAWGWNQISSTSRSHPQSLVINPQQARGWIPHPQSIVSISSPHSSSSRSIMMPPLPLHSNHQPTSQSINLPTHIMPSQSNFIKYTPKRKQNFSLVWNYFHTSEDHLQARCTICGAIYKRKNNTTTLLDHLRRSHRNIDLGKKSSSPGDNEKIVSCILKMICLDLQPFSIMKDVGFRSLMDLGFPGVPLPSRSTLSLTHLPILYNEIKKKVISLLLLAQDVHLTTDCWTSLAMQNYLTLTCHFIVNWRLFSLVLHTDIVTGGHGADNCSYIIRNVLEDFNIFAKSRTLTTDNASSMEKTAHNLNLTWVGCLSHTLNLCLKNPISATHYHKSTKATESLEYFELYINNAKHKVQQDVVTRWNSTLIMLKSIIPHQEAFEMDLFHREEGKYRHLIPPNRMWILATQLLDILDPFLYITEILAMQEYPTASLILPTIKRLINKLTTINPLYHPAIQEIGKKIHDELISRTAELPQDLFLAALLDPRFKKLEMISDTERRRTLCRAQNEMSALNVDPSLMNQVKESDRHSRFWNEPTQICENDEILRFLNDSPQCAVETNVLDWWKENQSKYSCLAILARRYLSIPSTSTPSECNWSTAGDVLTKKRSLIKSHRLNQILFLNKNMHI